MSTIRLNKALADAGVCSRRKADELISQGYITVNGTCVDSLGYKVTPEDIIAVQGKPLASITASKQTNKTYILLHKPVEVISTVADPEGRTTVIELLPQQEREKRLYPVGRLDYFSEGLLLLTDDGNLTHKLTHPRFSLPKVYEVTLREAPTDAMLALMRRGMTLAEGEKLAPVEVTLLASTPSIMQLVLRQGLNRQIRRMCRDLGLTILRLVRTRLGPIDLGTLAAGACRHLTQQEIQALQKATESAAIIPTRTRRKRIKNK